MRVTLKRLVIDGGLRWAEAHVQAVPLGFRACFVSAPDGEEDDAIPLSVKPGSRVHLRPAWTGARLRDHERIGKQRRGVRSVVCVRVKVRLTAGDTLAQIRERARDEALRYLDVA